MITADPCLIAAAVLVDLFVGDPRWLPHPVVGIGSVISFLEQRLLGSRLNQRFAGVLLLASVMFTAGGITWLLLYSFSLLSYAAAFLAATIISFTGLAIRSLHCESALVANALHHGDILKARHYLSYIVGRDTENLQEHEIWRALVETVAENTSDAIIAPLFWLLAGGPVALMVFKAVSTLDSMVGYKNNKYLDFGRASAKMDDLLNFFPARITAALFICAAPFASGSAVNAWRITCRDRFNHPSPNSGHPEAAAAGAFGIQLGGAATYGGVTGFKQLIGTKTKPINGAIYNDMIKLMYVATALMISACMMFAYLMTGGCLG